jgi:F0F1-type ATP synthase membrane subunit b/b'
MTLQEFKTQIKDNSLMSIIARHFTTFVVILGAFWWLGKPRAEEFIRGTVNDRIEQVENGVDAIRTQNSEQQKTLDDVQKQQGLQQDQLNVQNEKLNLVLDQLKKIQEQTE